MKKHGGLLTHFAFKANVGLDHKLGVSCFELTGQRLPLRHGEHHAIVAHRHSVAVYRAGTSGFAFIGR